MTCIHDDDDDDEFFLFVNFNQFCVSEIAIKIGIADAIIFCKSIQKKIPLAVRLQHVDSRQFFHHFPLPTFFQ